MPKLPSNLLSTVITFFVTLTLNAGLSYFSSEKGTISISRPIILNQKLGVIVAVENYTDHFIDDIVGEVPNRVSISDIVADYPIRLSDSPSLPNQATRMVKIGQIAPRTAVRIIIPIPNTADASTVKIVNANDSGLTVQNDSNLASPIKKALATALMIAVIYTIANLILGYYTDRRIASLEKATDLVRAETSELKRDLGKAKTLTAKQKILLLSRISDYSKELNFWRDTIRALLITRGAEKKSAEQIISGVTESLKTYGTRPSPFRFDEITVVAALLRDSEKESGEPISANERKPT